MTGWVYDENWIQTLKQVQGDRVGQGDGVRSGGQTAFRVTEWV